MTPPIHDDKMRNLTDDDRRTDNNRTDTDASAGWRAEYRYQEVGARRQLRADGGDRPADCDCWETTGSLPCFRCYAAGFGSPNPEPEPERPVEDTGEADREPEAEAATDGGTDAPDTHQLADRLGVREELLRSFGRAHPDPTAAVVLGWAHDVGELEEPPASLEDVVEEWLVAKGHTDDLRADGGTYRLPTPGDVVVDGDSADDAELVVVETHPDRSAADYYVQAIGSSVADVNPRYDAAAPVVEAVYLEEAEETLDGVRSVEALRDAVGFDAIGSYAFPCDRLASRGGRP